MIIFNNTQLFGHGNIILHYYTQHPCVMKI